MNIGIFIYPDAEVLDFSGPFEVFSTAGRFLTNPPQVFFIAESTQPVVARGGMQVLPHYDIANHPKLDLLVVVGGVHTEMLNNIPVIEWLAQVRATQLVSICTGAFLLAKAKRYQNMQVTTHWEDQVDLANMFPDLEVLPDLRWVNGEFGYSSGGISAGIDLSLHLVEKYYGASIAKSTALQMEYRWQQDPKENSNEQ
ncbi:DJ-1/PfpI family protein [Vibrio sp. SCSIO 43136]|uniref:DJ-1/PfpI family protein n=1 Tax=Vibrio sp. SCSIO 43136 TaxID=2819101 RepID=UPI002075069E|nr:DJ-1/PfpI family protein [Vibrio sp. SCSIO 43136]USD64423.1 DJ-1/PfpI family protein [Vibrio sp. SCSIO 43136]